MTIIEVKNKYHDLLNSIKVCKDNDYIESVFILMYALIDSLSWLNSSELDIQKRLVHDDFIKFCDEYIINQPNFSNKFYNLSSEEIYNARCAVVHTISAKSKNNIKKNIRYLTYSNNMQASSEGNQILNSLNENSVCISVTDFLATLTNAVTDFFNLLDENKKNYVIKKADEYYSIY